MWRCIKTLSLLFLLACTSAACSRMPTATGGLKVAFISDVHLSDIFADFADCELPDTKIPGTQRKVLIRTMQSQLNSTRLFNENYFAFIAALDDVAQRGIKLVILPGDFSDDGQPYNVRGLEKILRSYSESFGMEFFIINGNHDPVWPLTTDGGKSNFLGENGKSQPIMSREGLIQSDSQLPVVVTNEVSQLGYESLTNILSRNGLEPQPEYLYWATPFSTYTYESYSFKRAKDHSLFNNRQYVADSLGNRIPDVSYVVEPMEGLWLLALDGNVYLPSAKEGNGYAKARLESGGEYSNIILHKKHLLKWVEHVVRESKRLNKTLITFSHYPMIDFYDGAANDLKQLFGEKNLQLFRIPSEDIAELFAKAGIKVHWAGHLHLNDTGVRHFNDTTFLVNIQIPSLAGYPSAYKILTIHSQNEWDIETVRIDSVAGYNELFALYGQEYDRLQSENNMAVWNKDILTSKSYHELIDWHLKELVRLRFIPKEWPAELKHFMLNADGNKLLSYAGVRQSTATSNWTGLDMIVDFYRLLMGDQLAINDLDESRFAQYKAIIESELSKAEIKQGVPADFHLFVKCFSEIIKGEPCDHFQIDMNNGKIRDLNPILKK